MADWEMSWKVNSESTPGVSYTVSRAGDVWGCTCPRWINQRGSPEDRKPCKHIRLMKGEVALNAAGATRAGPVPGQVIQSIGQSKGRIRGKDGNRWSVLEI